MVKVLLFLRPDTVFEKRETSKADPPCWFPRTPTLNSQKRLQVPDSLSRSPRTGEKDTLFLRNLASQEKTTSRALTHMVSLATQCSRALRVLYSCTHARHAFRAFALLHSCHRCGCSHIFHRLLSCTFRGSLQAWPRAVRAGALVILHVVGHACASLQWRTTTSTVMECLTGAPAF